MFAAAAILILKLKDKDFKLPILGYRIKKKKQN
jgi:hypothetical protein